MESIVNVSHDLSSLRSGIILLIDIEPGRKYEILANGRGCQIERTLPNGEITILCDFTSFTYPDDIQEDEKDLLSMLIPLFDNTDREMIELAEMMVIHYQAGTREEDIDLAIRRFTKRFERG